MAILRLVIRNLTRRGWYFRISAGVLVISILGLLASLGALRGIEARIAFIDDRDLRKAFRLVGDLGFLGVELENELLTLLSKEEGMVGVAGVKSGGIGLGAAGVSHIHSAVYVNLDAAKLLAPNMKDGIWLADIDWGSSNDPVPIVVSNRIGKVGNVIHIQIHDLQRTAQIIGVFEADSYYFASSTELLPQAPDVILPASILEEVPLLEELPHLRNLQPFGVAESQKVLQANQERWTEIINDELERLGLRTNARIKTMDDWVDEYLWSRRETTIFALWLTAIVVALTAFGYGSINAVSIWDRGSELGIYFATGATSRRIVLIALLEMVFPLLFPLLVSLAAWRWGNVWDVIVVDGMVIVRSFVVMGLIGLLSTCAPFVMLRRVKPAMLIRGGYR